MIILALLAMATFLLARDPSNPGNQPPARLDTRLDYALRDFNGRLLDKEGELNLQITSPLLRKNAQSEVGTVKSPEIHIKQEDQQWHIKAESAIITADREFVSLVGDVHILRRNEINGETLEITTRDVILRVTPRTASTESLVTLVQKDDRLDALGMNLDIRNNSFELLNEVRATYDIP